MMGDGCVLHSHPRLVPIVRVPLRPLSRGGPANGPAVEVCANAAAMIYDLLERIENVAAAGPHRSAKGVINDLPSRYLGLYPGAERVVAYRLWLWYGDAYLRGELHEWTHTWHPDGRSRLPGLPSAEDLDVVARWPARIRRRLSQL